MPSTSGVGDVSRSIYDREFQCPSVPYEPGMRIQTQRVPVRIWHLGGLNEKEYHALACAKSDEE
jgi:hypothetical protein